MRPDSPIATEYRVGVGVRSRLLKPRPRAVGAIVIHDTGPGPAARVNPALDHEEKFVEWRKRWPAIVTPFQATLWVYEIASPDSGHYVVGQDGECTQVVPEDLVARHVGATGKSTAVPYRLPFALWASKQHAWWKERWRGLSSPRELAGGTLWAGGSCNDGSIAIEVSPHAHDPEAPWSDAAWSTLARLVVDICERRRVPCLREYVPTHSDAHPRARTAKGAPTDPSPAQWSWQRFAHESGAPF
jgi:hypothetical protein